MVNRNLLRQFDLPEGEMQHELDEAFGEGALDWLPVKFDAALAVWVFQHCLDPAADIERVKSALAPGAPLFAVNSQFRLVPTTAPGDWSDDGVDVFALLDARLARTSSELLSPNFVPAHIAAQSVWGVWRRS